MNDVVLEWKASEKY